VRTRDISIASERKMKIVRLVYVDGMDSGGKRTAVNYKLKICREEIYCGAGIVHS